MIWGMLLLILPVAFIAETPINSEYKYMINVGVVSSVTVLFLYAYFGRYSFQVSIRYFFYITVFLSSLYLSVFGLKAILGLSPLLDALMGFVLLISCVILAFYLRKKLNKLKSQMGNVT
jgi:hypothetical protein